MNANRFVEQVQRSALLYRQGLITVKEFTDVTLEDLHRLETASSRWEENL